MPEFKAGDRVLVNGNIVATLEYYDEPNNNLRYITTPIGGGTDTVTAHISQTRLEHLTPPAPSPNPLEAATADENYDDAE